MPALVVPIIHSVKRKYDSYEVEIIVSLGFLILFLISINFISGLSFENARRWQMMQFEKNLYLATDCAVAILQSDVEKFEYSETVARERLRDISFLTGISDMALIDTLGKVIAANSGASGSPGGAALVKARKPLSQRDGRIVGYVTLAAPNVVGARMERLSRWDAVFRIVGLISALVVGAYFLKAILLPYRRIKREAMDFNFDISAPGNRQGIEYIVNTFKDVIAELEEKKSQLEIMYRSSERRADSLARYNEYILGSITSGVVICDSSGIVTRFNEPAQDILQHLENDCRDRHYSEIFGAESKLVSMLDDALLRKIVHSRLEFEIKRPDGKRLWLGCSSSMINDEKGEGMGAVLLLVDLTEIRRLQELSSYSEKMVALGETAAGLAHEVRNSFAAILGFSNLLRKNPSLGGKAAELAEAIRNESVAAETLMTRFLSFARPLELHAQDVSVQELIQSTLRHFSHPKSGDIRMETELPDMVLRVDADPVLMKQALSNLILNACDALYDGGEIRIRASLEKGGDPGASDEIKVSITDNGIGIEPEKLPMIFDPFFTGKPDGTGLGLALVKKIVVLHGGRIDVRSKPGKGTRFTIHLPARLQSDIDSPARVMSPAVIPGP